MPLPLVAFVPGFLGSTLTRKFGLGLTQTIWMSPTALLAGYFRSLAIDVPGYPPPEGPRFPVLPGGPQPYYYGLIETYLEARGWDVESPDLDWRGPVAADGVRMADWLLSLKSRWPARVVCHSRGGLVTRAAMAVLAARGETGAVSRVIGLGVPHRGSIEAVNNCGGGGYLQVRLLTLGTRLPFGTAAGLGLHSIRLTMRSWPAIAELMPDPVRSWLPADIRSSLYLPATWAASEIPPVDAYLSGAVASWAALPDPPSGVDWIDVAGSGVLTPDGLLSLASAAGASGRTYTQEGDGVVPVVSAAVAPRKRILTPTGHDSLPLDGRLWPVIHRMLRDGLAADETLTGRVLQIL